ncbi:general stress protein 26 [Salsuginibacillus halophilus]|uniref:General stress protein 26 n=1 Tax=Salsuginibacillus halophilus TaxID=517424 RepID=A0A2P8HWJ2_9BACI|nr:pyridoxamine 5'-phosphate oxidase family protein [Salsuginibacillus halophilus]PSL50603.1 general stress protein 26 [Salsuginibacillus halophilus]
MNEDLKKRIKTVLEGNSVGVLATIKDDQPYARYMTFWHDELVLYTPTRADAHKVEDIEANPNVHILLGYEDEGQGDTFVEIEAEAVIEDDADVKAWMWSERMDQRYNDPEDPALIVLKCTPSVIRYRNDDDINTPQEVRL